MARSRFGERSKPRRQGRRRVQRTRVLIVCGGDVTEYEYFQYVKDRLGASGVQISIERHGESPLRVLGRAIHLRDQDRAEAKRLGDRDNVFNAVWVVVDHDNFDSEIPRLLKEARNNGVEVAFSNPCFEYWLVLHKTRRVGYLSTGEAQSLARSEGLVHGRKHKNVRTEQLEGRFESAEANAERSRREHLDANRKSTDNPSTTADRLVRSLIKAESRRRPGFQHGL